MKRPANGEKNLDRIRKWREICPEIVIRKHLHCWLPWRNGRRVPAPVGLLCVKLRSTGPGALPIRPSKVPRPTNWKAPCLTKSGRRTSCTVRGCGRRGVHQQAGQACRRHHASAGRQRAGLGLGGVGRTYADAPEIDGTVRLLPPEKASKTLKVGEFTKARIVAVEGMT